MADQQQTPSSARLLDIDTLIVRPTVAIDGVPYELLVPDELSVLDYKRLNRIGVRMAEIENKEDDPTPEEAQEYEGLAARFCARVLLAPDDVQQRLAPQQRAAVSVAFMRLRMAVTRPQPAGANAPQAEAPAA